MSARRRVVRRTVNALYFAALLVFLFLYVRTIDFNSLHATSFHVGLVALATLVSLAFRFWGVVIWRTILRDLGASASNWRVMNYVYAKSWMGRYLPGKVTWIVGKIYFASQQGIGKRQLTVSATLEAALQIAITLVLSLLCLAVSGRFAILDSNIQVYLLVVAALILVALHPKVFNLALGSAYRLLRRGRLDTNVTWRTIGKGWALYGVSFVFTGLAYYAFSLGLYPGLDPALVVYVAGAFNLAGIIGVLAIFAPSGIGVREAVQLVLLIAIMPADVALVLTVASRLWSTIVDVIYFGLSYAWNSLGARGADRAEPVVPTGALARDGDSA